MSSTISSKSLVQVHRGICAVVVQEEPEVPEETKESHVENTIMQAITDGKDGSPFHDALHEYCMLARPTTSAELSQLSSLVNKLIQLCGVSKDAWKIVTLTAILRRYHEKAPEARLDKDSDTEQQESVGDGERLVFYGTLLALYYHNQAFAGDGEQSRLIHQAVATMIRTSARIGGSRDLCAIIEHLTFATLVRTGRVTTEKDGDAPGSFATKLVPVVRELAVDGKPDDLLELALRLAAEHLDQDLRQLEASAWGDPTDLLLSTIHVSIPHNGRGSNTKGAWQRKLVNGLAEIMIWQRTSMAQKHARFVKALGKFRMLPKTAIDQGHALIQQLQATVRKQRQKLNAHARQRGFLLTSSYLIDKRSLTLRQIRRAKEGDLKLLKKMATKNGDGRIMKLIAKRHMDPTKATAMTSIQELVGGWIDVSKDYRDDEIAALELSCQTSTVEATLAKMRPKTSQRKVWITCVGNDRDNLVCAILVAASLEKGHLLLANEEYNVSSTEKCIALLNEVIMEGKFNVPTEQSVEDVVSTRVGKSNDVLVLASHDLELDEKTLLDMQVRDVSLNVHSTRRIEMTEPVSVSLNDDIYQRIKEKQPLSLGVMLDCTGSMGGEIDGCKKGAMKLISTFRELAPVKCVNFLGYWDPVNVRSDPQAKSTGYLKVNQKNMDAMQTFVNKELVCQGGGDEPEDIPAALEKFADDMTKAGLSADKGVHLLFFIADAGFRANEDARVRTALGVLKDMGIVMVMCRVRGGSNLLTFTDRTNECFKGDGQYIELDGIGQLESIASTVTESIRASLFKSGNVVSVTASIGQTMDAVRKLANFQQDHSALKKTEELAKLPTDDADKEETEEGTEAVFADKKKFTLTSRDRLYLQLSQLPPFCHHSVVSAFGGKSMQELSASMIAERLRQGSIPLTEIQEAGYPNEIVDQVKNLLGGYGAMRVDG